MVFRFNDVDTYDVDLCFFRSEQGFIMIAGSANIKDEDGDEYPEWIFYSGINPAEFNYDLPDDCAMVRTDSFHQAEFDFLMENGIIFEVIDHVSNGYINASVCRIDPKIIEDYLYEDNEH